MAKKKQVPAIRFQGFADPWEQRKLGDLVQFSKGTGYSKGDLRESGTPIILYGRLYTKYETVISEVDTFADAKAGSVYSRGGEVIVPASGETAEDISIASVVEKSGVLLGGDLNIITPPADLDAPFLAISISNGKPHEDMAKMAQGKSVVHLHNTDLEKIDLTYPSHEEQIQISGYFGALDHLITLHQREESCAASFSASCFGTLKAFFWEQRKLLDCIQKITDFRGRTPKKLGMDWSETGYLALSALNVKDGYIDFSQDVHYGDQALYDKWMTGNELHKGQVLFTTEAPMGNVAQIPDNRRYILSQRTIAFDAKSDLITENFLATILRTPTVFASLTALSSGGTAKGVSQKSLATVDIILPVSLEEQEQLASMFAGIDTLITLHQCKPKSRKGGSHVLYSYQV